ncbi:MAG: efflux RND transporter periplasmic adaptor subunit, partial [Pseudomonadales bacterium]|nr:efflux RND transporter periplasmic adaptor subunit [Pseudomonadales bacterium]
RLPAARVTLKDAKTEVQRQQKLYRQQLIAVSTLETAKTLLSNAETQLIVAQNDVHQAKQDIEKTEIKAPFNAVISERHVDRLAEVAGNTAIVQLASDNSFQIRVLVPESIIRFVQYQQTIQVILPRQDGLKLTAEVNEIAASSSSGNAYAVTAQFAQGNDKLRAGMSAKASFFFANTEHKEAFLIPISAVSTRDAAVAERRQSDQSIPLYIIDAKTSKARLIWVTGGETVASELEITAGLNEGDRVISAGVAFVKDGMHVRPWQAK